MQHSRLRSDHGFTLVEVLVSVALIAVCAVPMLQLFTASGQSNTSGRYTSIAASVARATLEEVRAGLYNVDGRLQNGSQSLAILPAHPDFQRDLVISDDTASRCKKVTVTVGWAKGSGSSSIQVSTLIR